MLRLHEYVTEEGRCPFAEWLEGLRDRDGRARIRVRLERVREGNFGDYKRVGGGVAELRVPTGPGYRVYYARDGETVVLLLCGGDKSTQADDIRRARAYWSDYQARQR
jgi:putative addiction module killer protein